MRIVLLGPPGSGKGTYATRLSKLFNVPHLSTGDLVREEVNLKTELGQKIRVYLERGELVPDETINGLVKQKLASKDAERGFILDGYPRTIAQAQFLNNLTQLDAVVYLEVPDETIVERLSTRIICEKCGAIYNEKYLKPKTPGTCDKCGGLLRKRKDDEPKVILERLKVYRKDTMPLIKYFQAKKLLKKISIRDTAPPPDKVVEMIAQKIGKPLT
ncbi:MAG: adenylate kinase [Candidatus Bathyarchaeia archaeon]